MLPIKYILNFVLVNSETDGLLVPYISDIQYQSSVQLCSVCPTFEKDQYC